MAVCGVPEPRSDHVRAVAQMALQIRDEIGGFQDPNGRPYSVRVGIDSGPVIAGVIGIHKFAYDLWGDTVNTASRMESTAPVGRIQMTEAAYAALQTDYAFDVRSSVYVKGKGRMQTYILRGPRAPATEAYGTIDQVSGS